MNAAARKSFLIFSGGNDRAVFGFLRALRLCGERPNIIARTAGDRILSSDFQHDVKWVRPTHTLSLDVLYESVRRIRSKGETDSLVILPSSEYLNTFLLRHRREIEELDCEIPLVDEALYMKLTQKKSATAFFSNAGISMPSEVIPSSTNQPIVAKPLYNVSALGHSLYPQILNGQAQIEEFMSSRDSSSYFFQEYVKGDNLYLLFYLSQKGECDFIWSQRNLIQQPGGKSMLLAEPSTFHESETARRIIGALHRASFHGLGMVEVIRGHDRDTFIEMNPRIWGPAQFCLDQAQPLLQAFIGETLYREPLRFTHRQQRPRRRVYFWLDGFLSTINSGESPTWHSPKHPAIMVVLRNIFCDIYLRKDSWRCFLDDLWTCLKKRIM